MSDFSQFTLNVHYLFVYAAILVAGLCGMFLASPTLFCTKVLFFPTLFFIGTNLRYPIYFSPHNTGPSHTHDDFVAVKMCHSPNPTQLGFMHMQGHCFFGSVKSPHLVATILIGSQTPSVVLRMQTLRMHNELHSLTALKS